MTNRAAAVVAVCNLILLTACSAGSSAEPPKAQWAFPEELHAICGDESCSTVNVTFPSHQKSDSPFPHILGGRTVMVQRTGWLKGESFKSGKWGHQQFTPTRESFHGYRVYKTAAESRLRHVIGDTFVLLVWLRSDSSFDLSNIETSFLRVKIDEQFELLYPLLPREIPQFDALSKELAATMRKYVVSSPPVAPNNSFKPSPLRGLGRAP